MIRNIKKTIRFTDEEYSKIEQILVQTQLDFTTFIKVSVFHKKIKFPVEKEILCELNSISMQMEDIAKRIRNSSIDIRSKKVLFLELLSIEEKIMRIAP